MSEEPDDEEGEPMNPPERRADPDPQALRTPAAERVGLDLERLRELKSGAYHPLVEYLTYIQVQRSDSESLVFVRQRDLDSLAALAGDEKDALVEKFKKLGVLLSLN